MVLKVTAAEMQIVHATQGVFMYPEGDLMWDGLSFFQIDRIDSGADTEEKTVCIITGSIDLPSLLQNLPSAFVRRPFFLLMVQYTGLLQFPNYLPLIK